MSEMTKTCLLFACTLSLSAETVTPVKLAPGVTTTLKRSDTREVFSVAATAGQTLLAELNTEQPEEDDYRVEVYAPGNAVKPLPSTVSPLTRDNWMNKLQQSGAYRVRVVRANGKPYVLRLTLLDPHDPRLDVGIRPEQISILDVHKEIDWDEEPFFPVSPNLGEFGPANIDGKGGRLHVRIVSVEGLKKTWWLQDEGAKSVAKLEADLKAGTVNIKPQDTPGNLNSTAEITFYARKQFLKGRSVRAVRWLCTYGQMDLPPVNPTGYCAEGITADGRFFFTANGAIDHSLLPDHVLNLLGDKLLDFRLQLARKLEAAPPDSFDPSLSHYDAMVTSLTIH